MSWGRIDDKFHSHPKVAPLANRNDPLNVWVRLLSWSLDHKTRGAVPASVALAYATQKTLSKLVDARLFDRNGDDYQFHDFRDYEPSAEVSAARRAAGQKGALARWQPEEKPQ